MKITPDSSDSEQYSGPEIANNMTSNNTQQQQRQRSQNIDFLKILEVLLQRAFLALKTPGQSILGLSTYLMEELGGYKAFDATAQFLIRHPFSGIILLFAFLLSLPFLILLGVGITIAVITFTGFIVLEGTLLTFVSILSFGCLGALTIVLTAIVVMFVSVYMGFGYIYDLYGKSNGIALLNFLKREDSNTTSHSSSANQTQPHTVGPSH